MSRRRTYSDGAGELIHSARLYQKPMFTQSTFLCYTVELEASYMCCARCRPPGNRDSTIEEGDLRPFNLSNSHQELLDHIVSLPLAQRSGFAKVGALAFSQLELRHRDGPVLEEALSARVVREPVP